MNSIPSAVVSRAFLVLAPISIALIPGSVTLAAGQTQQFVPTVTGNSNTNVTWSLNPAVGSISAGGLYTAPVSIGNAQPVAVTATSAADPTKSATAFISLAAPKLPVTPISTTGSMSFSTTQGSSDGLTQLVNLQNPGSSPLIWTAAANAHWIRFAPAAGQLNVGARGTCTFMIDPSGLGIGIHSAIVTIGLSDGSSQAIPVTLAVKSIIPGYPLLPAERTFPSDTGMINVKTLFGAKGDGLTDDTVAIQKAISQTVRQQNGSILYFPAGVYLVSSPLVEKDLSGTWQSMLTIQGENQDTTIIRLTDNNPRYQELANPTDVIDMASLEPLNPKDGGGNNGFDNYIFDITVDVGNGNPGAVALDFMGNNYCGLRNVTLSSSDSNHVGAIGLSLLRYATGPCLMKNLVINGFSDGVRAANLEYSTTFEGLTLLNQASHGIYNSGDVLSVRGLTSTNPVPAIVNESPYGLITLLQATLKGSLSNTSAILNQGTLYARNIKAIGYRSLVTNGVSIVPGLTIGEYSSGPLQSLFSTSTSSLNLQIQETPQFEDSDLTHWKSVVSFGADPTGTLDSSNAVQAAIDSGATTVYFPVGKYLISRTIVIRGNVGMIQGFDSWIQPSGAAFQNPANPTVLFQTSSGVGDLTISHLRIGNWQNSYPGLIFLQQTSHRPLALLNSALSGTSIISGYENTVSGDGCTFLEDFSTSAPIQVSYPGSVFARQLNPEVNSTKIQNDGAKLWILGLKTEQPGTTIETKRGGSTELLGGLIYPVLNVPINQSAFVVRDSTVSLIYAVSSYTAPTFTSYPDFQSQVLEVRNGSTRLLPTKAVPPRGYGVIVPLYAP